MITELKGKQFAFGMTWNMVADANVKSGAQGMAQSAKSPLFWYSSETHMVGLLDGKDKQKKIKGKVHAGAVVLASALRDHAYVFGAFQIEPGIFAVIGIADGKPKKDFDTIKRTSDEVIAIKNEFLKTIDEEQECLVVGNTEFLGGTRLELETITDYADGASRLTKARANFAISGSMKNAAIVALIAVVSIGAWDQYKEYQAREIRRKTAEKQKAIQDKYVTELNRRRSESFIAPMSLPTFMQAIKQWPTNIGGWWLDGFKCKMSVPVECAVSFSKSSYRLATYESFSAEAGNRFTSVSLDNAGQKISATIKIDGLQGIELGKAIDAAKGSDQVINELGSRLLILNAGKMPFASETGIGKLEFSDFALPAGVVKAKLTVPVYQFNSFNISLPARDIESFMSLPPYAVIESIEISIARKNTYAVQDSFIMATVRGSAFAKPL